MVRLVLLDITMDGLKEAWVAIVQPVNTEKST